MPLSNSVITPAQLLRKPANLVTGRSRLLAFSSPLPSNCRHFHPLIHTLRNTPMAPPVQLLSESFPFLCNTNSQLWLSPRVPSPSPFKFNVPISIFLVLSIVPEVGDHSATICSGSASDGLVFSVLEITVVAPEQLEKIASRFSQPAPILRKFNISNAPPWTQIGLSIPPGLFGGDFASLRTLHPQAS